MRRLCIFLLLATSAGVLPAADAPSETDLAGITYFAPVCPFYYRMMGPDGQLREFLSRTQMGTSPEAVATARLLQAPDGKGPLA